jgi:spore maturation protein CgeB
MPWSKRVLRSVKTVLSDNKTILDGKMKYLLYETQKKKERERKEEQNKEEIKTRYKFRPRRLRVFSTAHA